MPIPDLDDGGFLPPGVHDCTIDEVDDRFGRFQRSDRRLQLCAKLQQFMKEVEATGLIVSVIIDGSFVTGKEEPDDIDLILVHSSDHDFTAELRPFQYNVLSKRRVRRRYGFDVFVARDSSAEHDDYIAFFQQIRGVPNRQKGILMVLL